MVGREKHWIPAVSYKTPTSVKRGNSHKDSTGLEIVPYARNNLHKDDYFVIQLIVKQMS